MKYWKPTNNDKTWEYDYPLERKPEWDNRAKPKDLPTDTDIYALAYEIDNNTNLANLRCKPRKGQIIYDPKSECDYRFVPYSANGKYLLESGRVNFQARYYADTYEEAVEMYNTLIQRRINQLEHLIQTTKKDMIL